MTATNFEDGEPSDSKSINDLFPARLALHQVIKCGIDIIQSTVEFLDHVRFKTALDQTRKLLPQELGQNRAFLLVVLCLDGRSVRSIDECRCAEESSATHESNGRRVHSPSHSTSFRFSTASWVGLCKTETLAGFPSATVSRMMG